MARKSRLYVRVKVAWWVLPYLQTLQALCHIMGTEPDLERVEHWIKKGIKAEIKERR